MTNTFDFMSREYLTETLSDAVLKAKNVNAEEIRIQSHTDRDGAAFLCAERATLHASDATTLVVTVQDIRPEYFEFDGSPITCTVVSDGIQSSVEKCRVAEVFSNLNTGQTVFTLISQ